MNSKPSELQPSGARDNPKTDDVIVIRYTREFLLECAKSPLVERPEALPPTSAWFGEVTKDDPEANNGSRKLPGKPAVSDRIVLGPPKMSFASSSLGGMKRSEDNLSGFKKTLETSRENRSPRGPSSVLEQGFGRETIEKLSSHKLPKVTPKDITGLLSGMDRRRLDPSRSNPSLTGSRTSTGSSTTRIGVPTKTQGQSLTASASNTSMNSIGISSTNGNGLGFGSKVQRSDAPEWMSYNPESESTTKVESTSEPVFVDDIQAWKARMKEHERREKEKESGIQNQRDSKQDLKAPSRADSSSSWRTGVHHAQNDEGSADFKRADEVKAIPVLDKPLGRGLLSNEPIQDIDIFFTPGGIDHLSEPFESSSAFNKFFSQHVVAMSSLDDPTQQSSTRKTDGSRFARFFAEDESESANEPEKPAQDLPGMQLSLDQLFQAHTPISAATPSPIPPQLGRMRSEAQILESLKVKKSPMPGKPVETSEQSEDAFAFSKIMAALSKPPINNPD
ncbi:hypothetical protein BGZ65_007985, partial [Modicella reniformis]